MKGMPKAPKWLSVARDNLRLQATHWPLREAWLLAVHVAGALGFGSATP